MHRLPQDHRSTAYCSRSVNLSSTNDRLIASRRAGEGRSTMAFYVAMSGFIAANLTVIGAEMRNMRGTRKSPARNR